MTTKRMPDMQWMSGYVLMAFWAGYVFINKVLPWKMTAGTTGQWNFYYVFKFLLYLIGGFFTAPFVVLWTAYKFIRALCR
jgi:putative membrane protein